MNDWKHISRGHNRPDNSGSTRTHEESIKEQLEEKRLRREKWDKENKENAKKIMNIVYFLYPYRMILIPVYLSVFIGTFFLVDEIHQFIVVMIFAIPVISVLWAYFTVPKQ